MNVTLRAAKDLLFSQRRPVRRVRTRSLASLLGMTALPLATACAPVLSSGSPQPVDPRQVQPERPTVATHAGTVAQGYVEIETGVEADRNSDGSHGLLVPNEIKIGLAPRLQFSGFVPVQRLTGVPLGVGDLAAGVKWRLVDGDGPLQRFAILPLIKFPTGGERGTNTTDVGLLLIDSREIGPASVDINTGLTRRSGDGSTIPRTSTFWTIAGAMPVAGPIGWQLECFGFPGTHGPAGSAPIVAILTGPTLAVARSLALDGGIIVPVAGPQTRAIYAGLVANLGRLRR